MLGNFIGIFVMILVTISLGPTIQAEVDIAMESPEFDSTDTNLIFLFSNVIWFFYAAVGLMTIGMILSTLRNSGLLGGEYAEEYREEVVKDPNRKQTYKEYVKERLEIERMMR